MSAARLTLGTVQFGLDYGVANTTGQPSSEQARAILACAYEGGVRSIDTAASYGTSEEVIGTALAELGLTDAFTIVTKVRRVEKEPDTPREAEKYIRDSVETSLKRLRLDMLPVCMFHRGCDIRYLDVLLGLRDEGLVGLVGSSLDTVADGQDVLGASSVDALQLPLNLLDRRFRGAGIIKASHGRGIRLYARSAFLQGLLVMPTEAVPDGLAAAKPTLRKLRTVAAQSGLLMRELALRYVLSQPEVESVVVGVETVDQMRDNLRLVAAGGLPEDVLSEACNCVPDFPEEIVRPFCWQRS